MQENGYECVWAKTTPIRGKIATYPAERAGEGAEFLSHRRRHMRSPPASQVTLVQALLGTAEGWPGRVSRGGVRLGLGFPEEEVLGLR